MLKVFFLGHHTETEPLAAEGKCGQSPCTPIDVAVTKQQIYLCPWGLGRRGRRGGSLGESRFHFRAAASLFQAGGDRGSVGI